MENRCVYCTDACGWHRCVRYCEAKNLTLADVDAYRWAPSSLYNLEGHDIEATVLQMLRHASSSTVILTMLKSLRENDVVSESKYTCLQKTVLANTGAVYDADPTHGRPNQSLVLSHASFRPAVTTSKAYLEAELKKLLEKLQKVWDASRNSYRHYAEVSPSRSIPSQYLAFEQIRHRLENDIPCLVCIAAPAGFGKTELVSALLHYLVAKGIHWECIAVTGVAASQIVGSTVHSLIQASAEGESSLFTNAEKKAEFEKMQGFIFDEAMMAEEDIVCKLIEICQQIPLRQELRRRNSLPLFGYRDLLLCGDIRQLPPASGKRPFWSTACFRLYFEVFVLKEDRRHERDPKLREIKELLAWGGVEPDESYDHNKEWPVAPLLTAFITDCYLRGWGLSGSNVHPDIGTALFPKRRQVRDWNEAVLQQLEETYGDELDGVDIHGSDPTGAGQQVREHKRALAGIRP